MLQRILRELESAKGAANLNELSRKLDVEQSALEGMVQFWVRKGRLMDEDAAALNARAFCASRSCGATCMGAVNCPFMAKMPRSYAVKLETSGHE